MRELVPYRGLCRSSEWRHRPKRLRLRLCVEPAPATGRNDAKAHDLDRFELRILDCNTPRTATPAVKGGGGSRSIKVEFGGYQPRCSMLPRKANRNRLMQKSETAWKMAARMAALAEDTDDDYEREHFIRLRDAWITLANRCEPFDLPDVTEHF